MKALENTIPIYPVFTKVHCAHQKNIETVTNEFEPYSDFNFISLFSWKGDNATEVSLLNNNLVLKLPDYLDGKPIYSVIGNIKIDETVDELLQHTDKLQLIPETVINNIKDASKFKIIKDRNNFDYIYEVKELATLKGNKYKNIRNKCSNFQKSYNKDELVIVNTRSLTTNRKKDILALDKKWADISSREQGDISAERTALKTLLLATSKLDLVYIELFVRGELSAFSINEILNNNYAICHFEKTLKSSSSNIATFFTIEVVKLLNIAGCKWVNWEQDLGLNGLRQSKLSFRPCKMLKKYTITAPLTGRGNDE